MIYPESENRVYTGKLISLEYEIESIQDRLHMSSFIILLSSIFTFLYFLTNILKFGFDPINSTITISIILLYIVLWIYSYRFPLICFTVALIAYSTHLYLNIENLVYQNLGLILYRLTIPIILLIGIVNVFYSWYKIKQIKRKEIENPDCVIYLNYVIKGKYIYEDQTQYNNIVINLDRVKIENDMQLLTLTNKDQYINYSIPHHAYNKISQIFIEKPILTEIELVNNIFQSDLNRDIHLYFSILVNIYGKDQFWIDKIIEKIKFNFDNEKIFSNNIQSILDKTISVANNKAKREKLIELQNKIKNSV